ncbi:hypothetical protein B296_00001614 [Ensete ventricosum]|uniref:Uncharacterized protein n=1 Tax=Ensete ventricosum TaxID=4639 RepID=A0A427AFC1_ENSVE|nr:hypothetical protein B296_00001614 [Ensete ventricosum]
MATTPAAAVFADPLLPSHLPLSAVAAQAAASWKRSGPLTSDAGSDRWGLLSFRFKKWELPVPCPRSRRRTHRTEHYSATKLKYPLPRGKRRTVRILSELVDRSTVLVPPPDARNKEGRSVAPFLLPQADEVTPHGFCVSLRFPSCFFLHPSVANAFIDLGGVLVCFAFRSICAWPSVD